jgi:hypothetical protein
MIDTGHLGAEATQPITAIVTNAQAARRFLNRRPPDLDEVRQALDCIVRDAYRASDVIYRIRGLLWTAHVLQKCGLENCRARVFQGSVSSAGLLPKHSANWPEAEASHCA